jgi:hypothetical protein
LFFIASGDGDAFGMPGGKRCHKTYYLSVPVAAEEAGVMGGSAPGDE